MLPILLKVLLLITFKVFLLLKLIFLSNVTILILLLPLLDLPAPIPAHLESLCIPEEQCVEQCGLASPTGPHDGQHLPWPSLASHWAEIGVYVLDRQSDVRAG